jgi:ABC-type Mn2+/Zn2+ transport system permease subunit
MLLTTTGILLSWIGDIPSGSTIILLGVAVYLIISGKVGFSRTFRYTSQEKKG